MQLGRVEVFKSGQMSLKDVDPANIPEFEDVIVQPLQRELILIGKRLTSDDEAVGMVDSSRVEEDGKLISHQVQT